MVGESGHYIANYSAQEAWACKESLNSCNTSRFISILQLSKAWFTQYWGIVTLENPGQSPCGSLEIFIRISGFDSCIKETITIKSLMNTNWCDWRLASQWLADQVNGLLNRICYIWGIWFFNVWCTMTPRTYRSFDGFNHLCVLAQHVRPHVTFDNKNWTILISYAHLNFPVCREKEAKPRVRSAGIPAL